MSFQHWLNEHVTPWQTRLLLAGADTVPQAHFTHHEQSPSNLPGATSLRLPISSQGGIFREGVFAALLLTQIIDKIRLVPEIPGWPAI